MNELEKLIADSITERDLRNAAENARAEAEEARYDALWRSLLTEGVEAVKPQIPKALHPYIQYTYGRPAKDELDSRNWRPTALWIKNAPGLDEIIININWHEGRPEIYQVEGTARCFGPDGWGEAIAEAFDRYHERRREYSQAATSLG